MTTPGKNSAPAAQLASGIQDLRRRILALGDLVSSVASGQHCEAFELIDVLAEGDRSLNETFTSLGQSIENAKSQAEGEIEAALSSYLQRLRDQLRTRGLSCVGDTTNLVIDGIAYVRFDGIEGKVWVNDRLQDDCRVSQVCSVVLAERDRLLKNGSGPETFARELAQAYDVELASQGRSAGEQLKLDALHWRLMRSRQTKAFLASYSATAFREYTKTQLRADLFALLSSSARTADGRIAVVDSGADTAGALWMMVPALGRMGYIGRIRMVPAND